MTTELWLLMASIVLGFVQIVAQAQSATIVRGLNWNAGPRDEIAQPLPPVAGRLERALKNFLETFAFFAAAILMARVANIENSLTLWGAWLYLLGRAAHLPLYALGVRYVRSLAWGVATIGIALVLAGIVRG